MAVQEPVHLGLGGWAEPKLHGGSGACASCAWQLGRAQTAGRFRSLCILCLAVRQSPNCAPVQEPVHLGLGSCAAAELVTAAFRGGGTTEALKTADSTEGCAGDGGGMDVVPEGGASVAVASGGAVALGRRCSRKLRLVPGRRTVAAEGQEGPRAKGESMGKEVLRSAERAVIVPPGRQ